MQPKFTNVLFTLLLFLSLDAPLRANTIAPGEEDEHDQVLRILLSRAVNASEGFNDKYEAEVWLLDMSERLSQFVKDQKVRLYMLQQIHNEATRSELAPELVLAVIEVESRFDPFAVSKSGAQGLMQVMPFWLKEIGHPKDNLMKITTNLRMGCTILKYYLEMEKNDLHKALARYNGSAGSKVYSNKVLNALRSNWHRK